MNTHDTELPEPKYPGTKADIPNAIPDLYTADQLRAAIKADRQQRWLEERAQLDQEWSTLKHMQAQYEANRQRSISGLAWRNLKDENEALREELDRKRRGEPETEREKWLASLFPEDRMFEEIDQMARESYTRHMSLKRGQMVVRADSMDAHLVWATKRWIEENEPEAPQPAETVRLCDCELGHNGMGIAGRVCDCPAGSEKCPDASMGEHACDNKQQCWEPCGDLGKSAEHAKPAGSVKQETMTARELADRVGRGEKWKIAELVKVPSMRELIADDAYAATFQSVGQYRKGRYC
jgi:hypothetical protein